MAIKRPAPNKETCLLSRHFDFGFDDDDIKTMSKPFQPKNMQQSTSWGLKTFTAWVEESNNHKPQDKCPHDVLRTADKAMLAYWLEHFVTEEWRQKTDSLIHRRHLMFYLWLFSGTLGP